MKYYLGPWQWRDDHDGYAAPAGAIGALDLGTIPEMSRKASGRAGCFFWTDGDLPSEYTLVGSGDVREIKRTQRVADALSSTTSQRKSPEGETLADMLLDCLLLAADPLGQSAPRVAEPDGTGWQHLHLWGHGHGHVTAQRFEWGASPVTKLIKASLRDQFLGLHRDANAGKLKDKFQHLRVLDYWCEQYGVTDWKQFVPQSLQKDVPGRVKHETTLTDDFNRANNSSSLGTSGSGWSWANTSIWQISSNTGVNVASSGASRADSDLSSANHYAQATVTPSGISAGCGCAVRMHSSSDTYYLGWGRNNGSITYRLRKQVSGTGTTLNDVSTTAFTGGVMKTEINGSSLTLYKAGSSVNGPITDTSITGNLRCGVATQAGTGGTVDDWSAADLSATSTVLVQLERWARGFSRGMWTRR